jgi:hypothetical protein
MRSTDTTATANDAMIAAQARPPEIGFDSRRPTNALTTKPSNGSSGMRSSITISAP